MQYMAMPTHPRQNSKDDQKAWTEKPDPAEGDTSDGKNAGILGNHGTEIGAKVEEWTWAGLGDRQPKVKL